MDSVETVIINYKRPNNVSQIVKQLKIQSYPCKITICNCASREFALPEETLYLADEVYSFRTNHGSFNRYIPSLGYGCDFTYFHDDDMLPGSKIIEHFVKNAAVASDGVLFGQRGKRVIDGKFRKMRRHDMAFTEVDYLLRGYFLRSSVLEAVMRFRAYFKNEAVREDDMLLAWAVKTFIKGKIYLTPRSNDPDERMDILELPSPFALCAETCNLELRRAFWKRAAQISQQAILRGHGTG